MGATATKTRPKKSASTPLAITPTEPAPVTFSVFGSNTSPFVALRAVMLACATDDARPILQGVHIVTRDDKLIIEATDSYRLHQATLSGFNIANGIDALIPAWWLSRVGLPKGRIKSGVETRFTFTPKQVTVDHITHRWSTTVDLIDTGSGGYPNTQRLIETTGDDEGAAAFNPRYLAAAFRACDMIGGDSTPVRVKTLNPLKPARFEVVGFDVEFIALLMPVRIP